MNGLSRPGLLVGFLLLSVVGFAPLQADEPAAAKKNESEFVIRGLTGKIGNVRTVLEARETIADLSAGIPQNDLDLKRMAEWAMEYLARTPRKEFDYEPVFQCFPLRFPPVPQGRDVVVPCDTDARMNWEWYYMREIAGSEAYRDIEAAFHKRLLDYVQEDGTVLSHPGCYNEGDIHRIYSKDEYYIHIWGATKILYALAEDYRRTHNEASRATAKIIVRRLQSLAVYQGGNQCYFPCGMGALRQDGSVVPNWWNQHPAPLVEPLVNYYLATEDREALDFAKAYAAGIMGGIQPEGIRFGPDGGFEKPLTGQSHVTMHALWGIAHLGIVTGEDRYVDFVKKTWDWLLRRGTGTGWFPALPPNCNETCCISDMMSNAALIAQAGHPEYFDYVERYLRNYIANLQFFVTPDFEAYYRKLHPKAGEGELQSAIKELKKFQGGIVGGSGLNDWENDLLGRTLGFQLLGCCAPEGMRAIYTAWSNAIAQFPASKLGPPGVYVNLCLTRESPWGKVVSFMPDAGRLTVQAAVKETFFLRPPHWIPRDKVLAFVDAKKVPVRWSRSYVRFENAAPGEELTITYPLVGFSHEVEGLWAKNPKLKLKFEWLGNMVLSADPPAEHTPLFLGKPRIPPPLTK